MSKRWLTSVACLAASLVPALAQNTTGTISGVVRDPSNAVLPGARVIVTNEDTGLRREVLSNDEGAYRLPFLPIGPYSVRVEKEGFKSEVQTGVRLEILQVRTVEFTLELGALADTITVESRAPLLEAESSQAGEVIKSEQVTNLPLGRRNFMQLTFLAPMSTPAGGDFRSTEVGRGSAVPASAGQRPEQNNYQIDGIDNKETGRNGYAISPPVDSISEFKVQTGLAPAEFGRGGGTIVNVVTKGGTNEYHGTLYEFLRNEFFDARPYFADRKSPLKLNQFGGALGGPIKQNKLFFFGNYEGLRQTSSGNPPLYRVFTQNERNGIFTTAVRDPVTNVPFANNTIPRSAMNPISLKVLELVPRAQPRGPGAQLHLQRPRAWQDPHRQRGVPRRLQPGAERHPLRPLPVQRGDLHVIGGLPGAIECGRHGPRLARAGRQRALEPRLHPHPHQQPEPGIHAVPQPVRNPELVPAGFHQGRGHYQRPGHYGSALLGRAQRLGDGL